jgi:putative membrane protein
MRYLTEASKQALTAAVESIESKSAAEVVVAVRAESGNLLQTDLTAGALSALSTLGFLLFSPYPFSLPAILLDTFAFFLLGLLAARQLPTVRFYLTPRKLLEESVKRAARAEFFDAHISDTRGRTGILVYVSQTERAAEVLADSGVRNAVDVAVWEAHVRRIRDVAAETRDGVALAQAIAELSALLATCLPRAHDDVNELSNAVRGA